MERFIIPVTHQDTYKSTGQLYRYVVNSQQTQRRSLSSCGRLEMGKRGSFFLEALCPTVANRPVCRESPSLLAFWYVSTGNPKLIESLQEQRGASRLLRPMFIYHLLSTPSNWFFI